MKFAALLATASILLAGPFSSDSIQEQPFDFHDDDDRRVLADIRLTRIERNGEPMLRMVISAVGPNVAPIRGYQGVRGANRYTAEQLAGILTGARRLEVKTRGAAAAAQSGAVHEGRRGRIPERRLTEGGRIDFLAVTPCTYPLELIVETPIAGAGIQQTELVVDGAPRLRISYDIDGGEVRILEFASLGDPRHQRDAAGSELSAVGSSDREKNEPEKKPLPAPVADADWDSRDLEGKWSLYRKSVTENYAQRAAWPAYLAKRKDYAFLEWVALYGEDQGLQTQAMTALAQADAPQWMRVTAWLRRAYPGFGHGPAEAEVLLTKHRPGYALAWLEKHKKAVVPEKGPIFNDYVALKKAKPEQVDISAALPPLVDAEVLRHLDPPADLVDFGARRKADADVVYEQQVLRAISGAIGSGQYREPWIGKVLRLSRHQNEKVRQAAYLAFTHFTWDIDPKDSPIDEFEKVLDDPKESAAIREAALLAFSASLHPKVYVRLHDIALQEGHPVWRAAISQLNEIGDEFTLEHLRRLPKKARPRDDDEVLRIVRGNLQERVQQRSVDYFFNAVPTLVERAAWAQLINAPLKGAYIPWATAFLMKGGPETTAALRKLERDYAPRFAVPGGAEGMRREVQILCKQIQAARMK